MVKKLNNKWLIPIFIVIVYLFIAFLIFPSIETFIQAFTDKSGNFSLEWLEIIFTNKKYITFILNTLLLAISTVIVCGIIGTTLAFSFNLYDLKGKSFGKIIAMLPICLPGPLFVYACVNIFGPTGVLGQTLNHFLKSDQQLYSFTGFWPILLIHALSQYVNFYIIVSYGITKIDKNQLEAASLLGATRWKILKDAILVPLMPSIISASGLTFIGAVGSYAAPSMIGRTFKTLTVGIDTVRMTGNMHIASILSLISSVLVIIGLIVITWFGRGSLTTLSVKASPLKNFRFKNKKTHKLFVSFIYLLTFFLLLPIMFTVLFSVFPPKSENIFSLDNFTLNGYQIIWQFGDIVETIKYTLIQASLATLLAVIIASFLAYIRSRTNWPFKWTALNLAHYPTLISDAGYAVALIVTFNIPQWFVGNQPLYGSFGLLIIVMALLSVTLAFKNIYAALQRISPSLDEASWILGGHSLYTAFNVTLPIIAPAIFATLIITFIYKLQEYTINTFIGPIGKTNISMLIRSISSQDSEKARLTWVLGTLVLMMVIVLLNLYQFLLNKSDTQQGA